MLHRAGPAGRGDRARRHRVLALLLGAAIVASMLAAASGSPAVASPIGTVTTTATGLYDPYGIVAGPDGNLWFTNTGELDVFDGPPGNTIGRITPAGVITSYTGAGISSPRGITTGPDGNLWFTNAGNDSIGRITPAGVVANFTGAGIRRPEAITTGPDGNLWFTNAGNDSIGTITPAGVVANFTAPGIRGPHGITAGPDGNLWFTNFGAFQVPEPVDSSIGRITPQGVVTTFTDVGIDQPRGIAAGADGNLWFANPGNDSIGRISPTGTVVTFTGGGISRPSEITSGPDGNLWFTQPNENAVGRITTSGTATSIWIGTFDYPRGIAAGPDGNLWFATDHHDSIGRMDTAGVTTMFTGIGISAPADMARGPDGNVWFTNGGNDSIGRVSPTGAVSNFGAWGTAAYPFRMAAGPDGNLWFTSLVSDSISRITPAGVITHFSDETVFWPMDIAAGPDGNLWFTNFLGDSIGRISPTGTITNFTAPGMTGPTDIALGPDGNLWFTADGANALHRITPAGEISVRTDAGIVTPRDLATGPDGSLWFTNTNNTIGRIAADGTLATFAGNGSRITAGPDGNMWFTSVSSIGRITPAGALTMFPTPPPGGPITAGADGGVWFTGRDNTILRITASTEPTSPTEVTAVGASASAVVSWSPPVSDGASPVTGYTVTASPGGATCTWSAGPFGCTVTGLDDGTPYTFTVTATNAVGTGPPSTPSAAVTPAPGTFFHPLTPTRILDSRTGVGGWNSTPLAAGTPRALTVTGGTTGVPVDATAVVLNLTATASTADSYLTAFPTGSAPPTASNLNVAAGQTIANLATVAVGANGQITLTTAAGTVDVIADVAGYYSSTPGDRYTPLDPTRLLDSRTNVGGWSSTPLTAATPRTLIAAGGTSPVPATATAVILNLTATASTANTYLTASPTGAPTPTASTLNAAAGQTIANLATVKIGDNGTITLTTNTGSVDVIADIAGYYDPSTGDLFHPLDPTRILDSRTTNGAWNAPLTASTPRTLQITNNGGVPAGATAIIANTTITDPTADSYLTLHPTGTPTPTVSNLNYATGQTIPNLTATKIGTNGQITLTTHTGSTHVLYDLAGYFSPT